MTEHGIVTSVYYDKGAVACDVRSIRVNIEYQKIPVKRPHSGFIQMPKQGQTVAMDQLNDGTRQITHVVAKEDDYPEEMKEGELVIQLDDQTKLVFDKAGGTFDVTVSASGDLHLNSGGDVYINGVKQ